jgi:hypothetical protein
MRYAVYVRKGEHTYEAVNQVPEQLRTRTLAVRSFDCKAMAVQSEVVNGCELEPVIERFFANPAAAYIHVHYAAPGCYAARRTRVKWVRCRKRCAPPRPLRLSLLGRCQWKKSSLAMLHLECYRGVTGHTLGDQTFPSSGDRYRDG